jgi:hypothetical protein
MDYKAVLEEQVRELQKVQDKTAVHDLGNPVEKKVQIAGQIGKLVEILIGIQRDERNNLIK